jgi:hypothetical protein
LLVDTLRFTPCRQDHPVGHAHFNLTINHVLFKLTDILSLDRRLTALIKLGCACALPDTENRNPDRLVTPSEEPDTSRNTEV